MSIEFNLLYRWHASVSDQDREWTEDLFANLLPGFDMKTVRYCLGSSYSMMTYGLTDLREGFRVEGRPIPESGSECPAMGVWRVRGVVRTLKGRYLSPGFTASSEVILDASMMQT